MPSELNEREKFYSLQYPECYVPNGYNIAKCGEANRVTTNFKEVSCYDKSGYLIKTFECINDASRYFNISDANIGACCRNQIGAKTQGGMY